MTRPFIRRMNNPQWLVLGEQIHGHKEAFHWEFMCPRCGNVQSAYGVSQRNASFTPEMAFKWVMRECEGVYMNSIGCDYTLNGVGVRLHKIEVLSADGKRCAAMFEFADDPLTSPPVQPTARAEC